LGVKTYNPNPGKSNRDCPINVVTESCDEIAQLSSRFEHASIVLLYEFCIKLSSTKVSGQL